ADVGQRRPRLIAAGLGVAVLAGLFAFGTARLSSAQRVDGPTLVRLVQADIPQESKWSPEAYQAIVDRYVALTAQPGAALPDVVAWPEGALPATANDVFNSSDAQAIAGALQTGQTLLMGISRGEADATAEGGARYSNGLFALQDAGAAGLRIGAIYDAHRLAPCGEYLPMGQLMSQI